MNKNIKKQGTEIRQRSRVSRLPNSHFERQRGTLPMQRQEKKIATKKKYTAASILQGAAKIFRKHGRDIPEKSALGLVAGINALVDEIESKNAEILQLREEVTKLRNAGSYQAMNPPTEQTPMLVIGNHTFKEIDLKFHNQALYLSVSSEKFKAGRRKYQLKLVACQYKMPDFGGQLMETATLLEDGSMRVVPPFKSKTLDFSKELREILALGKGGFKRIFRGPLNNHFIYERGVLRQVDGKSYILWIVLKEKYTQQRGSEPTDHSV